MPTLSAIQRSRLFRDVYLLVARSSAPLASVYVTRAVYFIEDSFEHIKIHWMWWPAIGALPVGLIGYFLPKTLGVGYDNISDFLCGHPVWHVVAVLADFQIHFLGDSPRQGGTSAVRWRAVLRLAAGLGSVLGLGGAAILPHWGDRSARWRKRWVGMAVLFAKRVTRISGVGGLCV